MRSSKLGEESKKGATFLSSLEFITAVIIGLVVLFAKAAWGYLVGDPNWTREVFMDDVAKAIVPSLFCSLAAYAATATWRNRATLTQQSETMKVVSDRMFEVLETERLMMANSGNMDKKLLVMCADVNTPSPDHEKTRLKADGLWDLTISILQFNAFQDLLLTEKYLNHFLSVRDRTRKEVRIIVTNKKLKHLAALLSYLKISGQLGIDTYIFHEEDFLRYVKQCEEEAREGTGPMVGVFLRGMGELNISEQELQNALRNNQTYFLRWLSPVKDEIEIFAGGNLRAGDAPVYWKNNSGETQILVKEIVRSIIPLLHNDHYVTEDVREIDADFVKKKIKNTA